MPGRLIACAILNMTALAACGGARDPVRAFLDERGARRSALERSLPAEVRGTGYAQLRLERYGRAWEELPEWNPPVAAGDSPRTVASPIAIGRAALAGDRDALRAVGEQAFFRYPAQLAPWAAAAHAERVVRVELAGGETGVAVTCASCHAERRGGALVVGLANDHIDLGWGPGVLDVTSERGMEPVRIPDLRPLRFMKELHRTASVEQRDLASLAVRIETLLVVAHGEVVRPPRAIAVGLALYLWSLADAMPPPGAASDEGEALFRRACAGCHAGPALTGAPVAVERVATDRALARSPERGTGRYRVPSLRGVGERRGLLHDGSVRDLAALFDPARPGGHRFGLDLDEHERAELYDYVATR
jgi:cytochrome c5